MEDKLADYNNYIFYFGEYGNGYWANIHLKDSDFKYQINYYFVWYLVTYK